MDEPVKDGVDYRDVRIDYSFTNELDMRTRAKRRWCRGPGLRWLLIVECRLSRPTLVLGDYTLDRPVVVPVLCNCHDRVAYELREHISLGVITTPSSAWAST
jgi:hypothetical protein